MTREPALRRDGQLLERLLARDAVALGDKVGSLVDPLHELFLLLQLGELGRDETENDDLVLRQVGERLVAPEGERKSVGAHFLSFAYGGCTYLKATSACCVVLEVVNLGVELLEELLRNPVVCSSAKKAGN